MKRTASRSRKGNAYHHGDLKSALIISAEKLLERDGPEALSLRAVAALAGVSHAAPYNHFPDKDHLLALLAASGFRRLTEVQVAAAETVKGASDKMIAVGSAYVAFAHSHPQLYRLMFGVGMPDWRRHRDIEEAKEASYLPVKTVLATYFTLDAASPQQGLEIASTAAWSLVHGLSMLLIDGGVGATYITARARESMVCHVIARLVHGINSEDLSSA